MPKDILMHDSGNRENFSTGAVRDTAHFEMEDLKV